MSVKTSLEGGIEVTRCKTAKEFLDYLQLRNPRWLPQNATTSPWIFRGQRNSQWRLEPKALRKREHNDWFDIFEAFKSEHRDEVNRILKQGEFRLAGEDLPPDFSAVSKIALQVAAELYYVSQFAILADQEGFLVPEDKLTFGDITKLSLESAVNIAIRKKSPVGVGDYRFDPTNVEFALAQHHGVPTRLLDWTSMSTAAAFFAAEDAVKSEDVPDNGIAVWAIQRELVARSDLQEVTHRRGKIAYLHAQGGLFLYDTMANAHFLKTGVWRPFDEAIAKSFSDHSGSIIRKIILPAKQANEVIRLLAAENTTRAHLMPTYDNITETLKMRQLIEKGLK